MHSSNLGDVIVKGYVIALAAAALVPSVVSAAPVDLSGWTEELGPGTPNANWSVQGVLNDTVFQNQNSAPSVFFDPTANSQGLALSGEITVETTGDDDYIGFVLGFNSGDFSSASSDFWLIDWKQANQGFCGGTAQAGLSLSQVSGDVGNSTECDFWNHEGTVDEVARGSTLGSTGWVDNQTYEFDLVFTSSVIEVFVDGNKEISYAGDFTDGSFGFYNYSQPNVRYAGITEDEAPPPNPIPLPAAGWLLFAGIGGLAAIKRRKTAAKTA